LPEEQIKEHIKAVKPVINDRLGHLPEGQQRAYAGLLVSIAARARFEGNLNKETIQNPEEMRKQLINHLTKLSSHSGIPNHKLIKALEQ
jgi:hypothetical protein